MNDRTVFETWIINYFVGNIDLHRTANEDYRSLQTHNMWQAFKAGKKPIKEQ